MRAPFLSACALILVLWAFYRQQFEPYVKSSREINRHAGYEGRGWVDITGLDRLELLHRLWNGSYIAEYYLYTNTAPPEWDEALARETLRQRSSIDYFQGRAIKMDLSYNHVQPDLYEDHRSPRAVADIVREQRAKQIVPPITQLHHHNEL